MRKTLLVLAGLLIAVTVYAEKKDPTVDCTVSHDRIQGKPSVVLSCTVREQEGETWRPLLTMRYRLSETQIADIASALKE